jgi:hypothetical protein
VSDGSSGSGSSSDIYVSDGWGIDSYGTESSDSGSDGFVSDNSVSNGFGGSGSDSMYLWLRFQLFYPAPTVPF